jgi:hypothetical protein
MMTEPDYQKSIKRLLIAALVLGFTSLTLPWWMLFALVNGEMVANFNLFLWGIVEAGFYQTWLPFEWFSYITLLIIAVGTFLGLGGYRLLTEDRQKGRLLIIGEGVCTIGGCLFYLVGLFFTFANPIDPHWMIAPSGTHGGLFIAKLNIFGTRHHFNTAVFEFLSIGFFLAVISSLLVLTVVHISAKKTL